MPQIVDLICKKREGKALSKEEIEYFIKCVTNDEIEQCQLGAMLMAIYLQGMVPEETAALTIAMMESGSSFEWPNEWAGDVVDKHSTGGVGDKISLILTPALAACGLKVPMISGRGLGFSGGTLDKVEAIPGFTVSCDMARVKRCIQSVGCCIAGQTKDIVPADRVMYACRGITSTVECIPLIVASILSKKAVERPSALVLDIKFGAAAFMTDYEEANKLANSLVSVAKMLNINTTAIISTMDSPIGRYIGNALEVAESIYGLNGNIDEDLKELVVTLGGHLLVMTGKASTLTEGSNLIWSSILNGTALAKFKELIKSQGVFENVAEQLCQPGADVWTVLEKAKFSTDVVHEGAEGYVQDINARILAEVCLELGTGRLNQQDPISYSAGLQLIAQVGSSVATGQPWITIHHDRPLSANIKPKVESALKVGPEAIPREKLQRIVSTVQ